MQEIVSCKLWIVWSLLKIGLQWLIFVLLSGCLGWQQDIALYASPDVNAMPTQQGLSVRTQVYLLSNVNAFLALSFSQFAHQTSPLHCASILASQQVLLKPGQVHHVFFPLNSKAHAVAVVALFHRAEQWRVISPLNDKLPNLMQNKRYYLGIHSINERSSAN